MPLTQLAIIQKALGKLDEAERNLTEALDVAEKRVGLGHPKVLILVKELAELRRRRGQGAEADALFEKLLEGHRERFGPAHPFVADVQGEYARHLRLRKEFAREEELLRRAVQGYRAVPDLPRPGFAACLVALARTQIDGRKNLDQADRLLAEAEGKLPGLNPVERAALRHQLVMLRCESALQRGRHAEAEAALRGYREEMPAKGDLLLDVAFRYAGCVGAVEKAGEMPSSEKERLADAYAGEAVRALRQAWRGGAAGAASWETRVPLRPLRGRPEFRALMDDIRAGRKTPAGDGG
jgi:hypothetical protein